MNSTRMLKSKNRWAMDIYRTKKRQKNYEKKISHKIIAESDMHGERERERAKGTSRQIKSDEYPNICLTYTNSVEFHPLRSPTKRYNGFLHLCRIVNGFVCLFVCECESVDIFLIFYFYLFGSKNMIRRKR